MDQRGEIDYGSQQTEILDIYTNKGESQGRIETSIFQDLRSRKTIY
jgi:hypothetical protein